MKYKERTQAKRKYKQALLVTVTTITLGVSTLGSTATAFAAEEDNISVISSHTLNDVGTQMSPEEKEKTFWQKASTELNVKNGKKFAGTSMKEFLNFAKTGGSASANNALRAMVLAGFDFVPYGMFISPIVGYIWPEQGGIKEQLEKLKDEIKEDTKKQIADQHLTDLNTEFSNLTENITHLENSVNGKNHSTYYSAGSIEETRRIWAAQIEFHFGKILKLAKEEAHKIDDLPLYTQVAAAHIIFLKNLEKNGIGPKYQFDSQSLKDFYGTAHIQKTIAEYEKYIAETYKQANSENMEKIEKLNVFNSEVITHNFYDPNTSATIKQKLNELKTKYQDKVKDINKELVFPGGWAAHNRALNEAENALNNVINALAAANFLSNLIDTTFHDPAFNMAASLGTWIEEKDGKTGKEIKQHYYYKNRSGNLVTEWLNIGRSMYYFSPEENFENSSGEKFKRGELVIGWINTQDEDNTIRTYFLSRQDGDQNSDGEIFNRGQMVTGMADITYENGDKESHYFSPEDGLKNSDGEIFDRGQMMTKWVEIKNTKTVEKHWYYFNPDDGSMIVKKKAVLIGGKKYDFDSNGVCTTPNGY
ncbi:insecticidal delta-endotoxin Cry8Ea1 family protein [Bacillus sp. LCP25S3_G1]|uniref:insecticidal delta-endotoxin Cry8Ea1 family protein n=1 Tax=Bacillus sp. LCP25S3_G1 TaxID=3440251 RepID=UPI003F915223